MKKMKKYEKKIWSECLNTKCCTLMANSIDLRKEKREREKGRHFWTNSFQIEGTEEKPTFEAQNSNLNMWMLFTPILFAFNFTFF